MPTIPKDIIDSLIALAETQTYAEAYGMYEFDDLGGHKDIYKQGVEDGEIESSRQLLGRMGLDYNIRKED